MTTIAKTFGEHCPAAQKSFYYALSLYYDSDGGVGVLLCQQSTVSPLTHNAVLTYQ